MKLTLADWDKFKFFYFVTKAGSFTAAAENLNLSQSSLSRYVQGLENQIKTRLFERVKKGVILTRQGEYLFEALSRFHAELSRTEMLIHEPTNELQGTLTIATTMAMASVFLVHHLSDFMKAHSKMKLIIIGSDETLETKTHKADVSVRPYIHGHPRLVQEYIFSFHLKLFASKDYLEEFGMPQTPEDLDYHQLIVFGDEVIHPYKDIQWVLHLGKPVGEVREPYFCINSSQGMRAAAENGLGIVPLAQEYPGIETSNFVEVLPHIEKPTIPMYYVYPNHLSGSRRVRALGDYLIERLGDNKKDPHAHW